MTNLKTGSPTPEDERIVVEWNKCSKSPAYFIHTYCQIYDAEALDWIPFKLWTEQVEALRTIHDNQLTIALKARQLGMTWLLLGYALWLMLFRPIATILLFSKRDDEAVYIAGDERLRGMYKRLPEWMQAESVETDDKHILKLSNDSIAYAFPTSAGDSYTATFALVDEADLVPDLGELLGRVKPTVDAGGKLVLISRVDKSKPQSRFKQIYRAAKEGNTGWAHLFLSWRVRPGRTQAWYDQIKRDTFEQTGSLDDVHEQYPETDVEALAGKSLDKRIPAAWLNTCYVERKPIADLPDAAPAISALRVYHLPETGRGYNVGLDPAEGNPTSDDSAMTVCDKDTGAEVAHLSGKYQPEVLAAYADAVGQWFNRAGILPERNNHGHAVILWLKDNGKCKVLNGWDGKPGWLSSSKGKALMYDAGATAFREGATTLHTFKTYTQLASIEGSTLRAPEGEMDDAADSYVLALSANNMPRARSDVW